MLPPTTQGIKRSSSPLSSSNEPEQAPASSSPGWSDVAYPEEAAASSSSNAEASSKSASKAKIRYHLDHYIDGGFVVLQIEDVLFRVPSYRLADGSQFFNGMFKLPQSSNNGDSIEGLSDSNPIVIPADSKVNRDEFGDFMKVLYPRSFSATLNLSKAEWISVLKVARIWYFLEIRSMAISQMENGGKLTCIDKIILGRQNWVRSWVVDGLVGLCNRKETVSDEEAIQIDYITAVKVLRIRETKIERQFQKVPALNVLEEVQAAFSDEISHIASEELAFSAPEDEIQLPEHRVLEDQQPVEESPSVRPRSEEVKETLVTAPAQTPLFANSAFFAHVRESEPRAPSLFDFSPSPFATEKKSVKKGRK